MVAPMSRVTTGMHGLDKILNYLQMGDNVVLQVDGVDDYKAFVQPYVASALKQGRRVVYMRFANHPPMIEKSEKIVVCKLNANVGFESFSTQVHNIVGREGRDVFYVFDCLSDLLHSWATDLMIGNFFVITCPYLFELNTVAYFSILRSWHSFKTIARIRETTQVLLDVFNYQGRICVHPIKAWQRYSPTMFLPHLKKNDEFVPIMNSADAADLFSYLSQASAAGAERNLDYWDRIFLQAKHMLTNSASAEAKELMKEQLSRVMVAREKRILDLAKKYFTLEDLVEIKERLIGTGFIGGKSTGMLLARNILREDPSVDWSDYLELHDSFYIGSDVFYSYIVQNGWWRTLMTHKTKKGYFSSARELQGKMLKGVFPDEVRERFQLMLEYFGQSPIIVRSSSLLEDAFGNAFAGKYESYFCTNQGTPEERYENFEDAVRKIFASTVSEDALTYRLQRGLDEQDEQMALLVQRVSGSYRKQYFFPELAGVGLSYNTFVWKKGMDPRAGMLRIVFGLGTRAVNRVENDYPRIVALDDPPVKPYASPEDAGRFSQHAADVLNLDENRFQSLSIQEAFQEELDARIDLIGTHDREASERMQAAGRRGDAWLLTFDQLLQSTEFPAIMSRMLKRLETVYDYPVDIEFTANFNREGKLRVNLLQCRPFQTQGHGGSRVAIPSQIDRKRILLRQEGNFMGGSVNENIARIVYIDPRGYATLTLSEKYSCARLVGKINNTISRDSIPTILFGPGRWGTTTPAMGVPVAFSEINNVAAIAEIAYKEGSLIPDLSFGTHFFQDMVEMNIFYLAIYPEQEKVLFNTAFTERVRNLLPELIPDKSAYANVVGIYDVASKRLRLMSDILSQSMVCYFEEDL